MERSGKPLLVNADEQPPQIEPYHCPGEQHAISRAVHLGRLAAFYPNCRQCPRCEETGTLSPRRVAQLAETSRRGQPRSLFHEEGAGGVYLNDLTPLAARDIAVAFAAVLLADAKRRGLGTSVPTESGDGERGIRGEVGSMPVSSSPPLPVSPSTILLAGDGRPLTAELVAAAAEGLRSTGCNVIDVGPSTSPCLAFAVHRLQAAGGVLIGNPGDDSQTAGIKFWTAGPRPLSAGGSLEPIIQRYQAGTAPSARSHGQLRRFQADQPYLAQMAEHYHALRPLRVVVDSASWPTLDFLQTLAATVACEIVPTRSTRAELPRQIRDDVAHFAACIDGDGETCHVLDEQGRTVSPDRLLLLLARSCCRTEQAGNSVPLLRRSSAERGPLPRTACKQAVAHDSEEFEPAGQSSLKAVVLESETSLAVAERLDQLGISVARSGPRRAEMAAAMREHGAALGGGPSARFWHCEAGLPLCDALMTVTRLLIALSSSDEPLSKVLDRDAPLR
jgi:phosphomannomutase